jgi:hypothetical protein
MSEPECRGALITILKKLTLIFPADPNTGEIPVNTGRATILDTGVVHAAVFYPGKMTSDEGHAYQIPRHWEIPFDIFQRKDNDEATNWTNFATFRQAIVDQIDSYPTLNLPTSGIEAVTLQADNDPIVVKRDTSGQPFIWQAMRVRVNQMVTITSQE